MYKLPQMPVYCYDGEKQKTLSRVTSIFVNFSETNREQNWQDIAKKFQIFNLTLIPWKVCAPSLTTWFKISYHVHWLMNFSGSFNIIDDLPFQRCEKFIKRKMSIWAITVLQLKSNSWEKINQLTSLLSQFL